MILSNVEAVKTRDRGDDAVLLVFLACRIYCSN
jgi:hypothetical protein